MNGAISDKNKLNRPVISFHDRQIIYSKIAFQQSSG